MSLQHGRDTRGRLGLALDADRQRLEALQENQALNNGLMDGPV